MVRCVAVLCRETRRRPTTFEHVEAREQLRVYRKSLLLLDRERVGLLCGVGSRPRWGFRQKADRRRPPDAGWRGGGQHPRPRAHGAPFAQDIESLEVVDANGNVLHCSRTGHLYGDFQFLTAANTPGFLNEGVLSCYRPVTDAGPPATPQRRLSQRDWNHLLELAHTDQRLCSSVCGSEMITELYVPRERLAAFMTAVRADFREHDTDVIYGTVRLIDADTETALPWARQDWACVIFNLHADHRAADIQRAQAAFRRLIDHALQEGGSYFLTYHDYARAAQIRAAHPGIDDFLRAKLRFDPAELFQSDWYRRLKETLR